MDLNPYNTKRHNTTCHDKEYVNVFTRHKGKLDCCMVGEHCIETKGFPPCCTTPNRLSFWEEAKVNQQI
jgi:hypothetical protein